MRLHLPWQDGDRSLRDDERGIEGLPIRLVIAVIIGVMALGIMTQILGMVPTNLGPGQEVTTNYNDSVIDDDEGVTVTVIDNDGEPVEEATVIADSGTATVNDTADLTTGADGEVTFNLDSDFEIEWNSNQERGTVQFDVVPAGDDDYVDEQDNPELTVLRN